MDLNGPIGTRNSPVTYMWGNRRTEEHVAVV